MNKDPKQEVDEELRFHLEQRTHDYLARGMSPEAAREAAAHLSRTHARSSPPSGKGWQPPFRKVTAPSARRSLHTRRRLSGSTCPKCSSACARCSSAPHCLLIVAVNVAILVYARTATRFGEIAVRTALGATRGRVITQLFVEALVLSIAAAALGLALLVIAFGMFRDYLKDWPDGPIGGLTGSSLVCRRR